MEKYRVIKIGYSYYIQRWGAVCLDGMMDHDWKDCFRLNNIWCGIQKLNRSGKYRVIIPMDSEFINNDMTVGGHIGGKILTQPLEYAMAIEACIEFNKVYDKYN